MSDDEVLAKVTEMVIKRFEEARVYGTQRLEAKYIYSRLVDKDRRFWESIETAQKHWVAHSTRRAFVKKAIKALLKKGQLICLPVRATYKRYVNGKSYYPIHHYEYRWVENTLDLLVMSTAAKP